jgi:hypothetical protein
MLRYLITPLLILAMGDIAIKILGLKDRFTNYREYFLTNISLGMFFLIIPMVLVGLFLDKKMDQVVYGYAIIALIYILYQIVHQLKTIEIRFKRVIKAPESFKLRSSYEHTLIKESESEVVREIESENDLLLYQFTQIVVITLLVGYAIMNLFMPERGWDALHFYFPHAIYYYLEDGIPTDPNYYSFLPAFKPPVNVLLMTFGIYITGGFYYQLLPVLFIFGITFIVQEYASELGFSRIIGNMSAIFFLTIPSTYFMIRIFAYYQELAITFFFSLSLLYMLKYQNNTDPKYRNYYLIVLSTSLALTPLSKESGIVIFFMFLLFFKFNNRILNQFVKPTIISSVLLFLIVRNLPNTYYLTLLVAFLLSIYLVYLCIRYKDETTNNTAIIIPILIGLIISIIWLQHIRQIESSAESLFDTYFAFQTLSMLTTFSEISFIEMVYIENAHRVTWVTTAFVIILGNQFNGMIAIFKLLGFYTLHKRGLNGTNQIKLLHPLIWLLAFYIFWLSYHSTTSTRYLSVILVPLSIITIIGIKYASEQLINVLENRTSSLSTTDLYRYVGLSMLFPLIFNTLQYYPIIPFELLPLEFHSRYYLFHKNWPVLILYNLFIFLIYISIIRVLKDRRQLLTKIKSFSLFEIRQMSYKQILSIILLFFILTGHVFVELELYALNRFDTDRYAGTFVYEQRTAVQELYNAINSLNIELDEITIGVNIPGMGYFINRPFIDLMLVGAYVNDTTFLSNNNMTYVYEQFEEFSVKIIVDLKENHPFYPPYNQTYKNRFPFLNFLNTFAIIFFENIEFRAYLIF